MGDLAVRRVGSGRRSIDVIDAAGGSHPLNYDSLTPHMFSLGERAEWRVTTKDGQQIPVALIVRIDELVAARLQQAARSLQLLKGQIKNQTQKQSTRAKQHGVHGPELPIHRLQFSPGAGSTEHEPSHAERLLQ